MVFKAVQLYKKSATWFSENSSVLEGLGFPKRNTHDKQAQQLNAREVYRRMHVWKYMRAAMPWMLFLFERRGSCKSKILIRIWQRKPCNILYQYPCNIFYWYPLMKSFENLKEIPNFHGNLTNLSQIQPFNLFKCSNFKLQACVVGGHVQEKSMVGHLILIEVCVWHFNPTLYQYIWNF